MNNEFILPENWYIVSNNQNYESIKEWFGFGFPVGNIVGISKRLSTGNLSKGHNPNNPDSIKTSFSDFGTEITFEEFVKYVLKKKLIGYKLTKEEYKQAALSISNTKGNWENSLMPYDISVEQTNYISRLREAGVFDIWFKAIYGEEKKKIQYEVGDWLIATCNGFNQSEHPKYDHNHPFTTDKVSPQKIVGVETFKGQIVAIGHLGGVARIEQNPECFRKATQEEINKITTLPKINGYAGEDKGTYFIYGCAKLEAYWFRNNGSRFIKSLELSSGVRINEEQMFQIRNYLINRDNL